VPPERAREALKSWLAGRGFFAPSDLVSEARLASLRPLWWVGWLFDVDARISWTADSNHGARRAAWCPHAGQLDMHFDAVVASGSRGLREDEARLLAGSYDLERCAPDPTGLPSGVEPTIERFDVQRSQARARVLEEIQHVASETVVAEHLPGTRHRKLHVAVLLRRLATRRYAFPAYVLAYRYRDQLYRVVVSGHDQSVIRGDAPRSLLKILAVAGGIALLILGILLALLRT